MTFTYLEGFSKGIFLILNLPKKHKKDQKRSNKKIGKISIEIQRISFIH